jgi:hypothetical protein
MLGIPLEYSHNASDILLLQTPKMLYQPIRTYIHAAYMVGWMQNNAMKHCMMHRVGITNLLDKGHNICCTKSIINQFLNRNNMVYSIDYWWPAAHHWKEC